MDNGTAWYGVTSKNGPVTLESVKLPRSATFQRAFIGKKADIGDLPVGKVLLRGANKWAYPQSATSGKLSDALEVASSFVSSASWIGLVEEVDKETKTFSAVLKSTQNPDELADFDFSELSADDLELVTPGAAFYWNVGYTIDRSGRKINASVIRFKRIRHWTRREVEQARDDAKKFSKWL